MPSDLAAPRLILTVILRPSELSVTELEAGNLSATSWPLVMLDFSQRARELGLLRS